MGYPLNKDEIAFSDPTPDGIKFAAKYTGTTSFLVFRKWFYSECWKGWSYGHLKLTFKHLLIWSDKYHPIFRLFKSL